jgi:type II secretory pathway predicted ATPase ExeA
MNTELMNFFGLIKPFNQALFLETEHSKKFIHDIKTAIYQGGIIAIAGMVGSGKTTLLRKIQEQLIEEKQIIISRSLSTDKRRVTIGTLYTALFLDLVKEKNFQTPTQPEKRERKFLEILKKNDKPLVLFIDEAHDLHSQTLISLKRLIELSYDHGKTVAVVIAGHPKLKNDLRRPSMEEVGARVQIFTLDSLIDNKLRYCEWLLKQCGTKDLKIHDVIAPDALELLANSLITPLQINHYLVQALEKAYLIGSKPITTDIIQAVFTVEIDGLEAKLARSGYGLGPLCDVLNAKPSEVKTYLRGQLTSNKSTGFNQEINKLGVF